MTENHELFEKENQGFFSSCHWLRDLEMKYQQTIEINNDEKANPNHIIKHLDFIKDHYSLKLDCGSSPNFFVISNKDERGFEQILLDKFEDNILNKALMRAYHYLVLLNRKSMYFTFDDLAHNYNFSLKDIYEVKGIHPACFDSLNDIPSNIIKRCQVSYETYQVKTRRFVRQLTSYANQISAKESHFQNIAQGDNDSDKKETQINQVQNEIKSIERKIEKLSFEIEEELYVEPRTDTPTSDDISDFIADFVCYGLNVTEDIIQNEKANDIHFENNRIYTTSQDIIKSLMTEDIYFQDKVNHLWVKSIDLIRQYIIKIASSFKFNQESMLALLSQTTDKIKEKSKVNVFAFKENTLFFQNGMIELHYNKDGSVNYQFTHINIINHRQLMFKYATKMRMNIIYNEDVDYTFDDNPENEPVTPDYIFGALGRRGFETDNVKNERDIERLNNEAHHRANLLMQQMLNVLLPYNDVSVLKDTLLYFYNSANSGKSTYMDLMNYMVGNSLTTNLSIKDFSSKESFGLVNVKDKRLVLIDEATDGKSKIDMENIKKMTSKEYVNANEKNKAYARFKSESEFIFASNYEPTFADESEGTERRLLAFQLETGYSHIGNESAPKDLAFIKQDLIKRNDFKSACVKWLLERINVTSPIPQSVREDASKLVSKEDDVQTFINNRLRQVINEPFIVTPDNLYELYKIECISQGRQISKIRNKSNFKKALSKMHYGVHLIKDLTHSKVAITNHLIAVEGQLFADIHGAQNNRQLDNTLVKHFMDIMQIRNQELSDFYQGIINVKHKQGYLSHVTLGKKQLYVILPDLPQYNDSISVDDLKNIAKQQKATFLKKTCTDNNINQITNSKYAYLPLPINSEVSSKFYSYGTSDLDDKHQFTDFIKYE